MPHHLTQEIKRKLFHLLTLIYVVGYWFLPRKILITGLGITIFTALVIEIVRLRHERFNKFIQWLGILRKKEEYHFSGLIWTLTGGFFTIYFFENTANPVTKNIVIVSLLYAALGDTAAAIFGRLYGKIKIGEKTLEGSLACLFVNLVVGYFFLPWPIFLIGALASTFFEIIHWPLNDNLWLPVLSASAITHLMMRYTFL